MGLSYNPIYIGESYMEDVNKIRNLAGEFVPFDEYIESDEYKMLIEVE